jgi:hypothetical protein
MYAGLYLNFSNAKRPFANIKLICSFSLFVCKTVITLKILNPNKEIFINKNVSIRENNITFEKLFFYKSLNIVNKLDINCYLEK